MGIIPYKDRIPTLHASVFVAEGAKIIGDVKIGEHSGVWFNVVIRGDVNFIHIGSRTNVQDNSVLHVTTKTAPLNIGSNVTIGHSAVLHGCTIADCCLIGMGAIVMDHAIIEEFVIIAAGSVVLEKTICETGFLYAGIPAKKIKPLTGQQMEMLKKLPDNYVMYSGWFNE